MANSVNKISINGEVCNIEDSRLVTPNTGTMGVDIHTLALGSCTLQVTRADGYPSIIIGENVEIADGVTIGTHVEIGTNVTIDDNIHITKESLSGMTDVEWTSESDMNDFRTKGSYYIHGIRTKADDRLPINTVNSGASFAAHLTVVDGSLQPSDGSTPTEICVTQFLMLSNRLGGDGNMYFRTYNEPKNVEAGKGIWTDWKRMSGSVEGYIFSNTKKMNIDFGYQDKEVGLNYMVDNGTYQGVYINDEALTYQDGSYNAETGNGIARLDPTKIAYVETFIITTINDYAATAQVNQMLGNLGMPQKTRQICQFKQATNVLTGTSSYQKRTCLGNGEEYKTTSNWSNWESIGGSNDIISMERKANGSYLYLLQCDEKANPLRIDGGSSLGRGIQIGTTYDYEGNEHTDDSRISIGTAMGSEHINMGYYINNFIISQSKDLGRLHGRMLTLGTDVELGDHCRIRDNITLNHNNNSIIIGTKSTGGECDVLKISYTDEKGLIFQCTDLSIGVTRTATIPWDTTINE